MGNGKNRKDWKTLSNLVWNKKAYLCDKNGNSVSADVVAKPNYDPWITIQARKPLEPDVKNRFISNENKYAFLYHQESGQVFYKKVHRPGIEKPSFHKIKSNRKIYKKVIGMIEDSEISIFAGGSMFYGLREGVGPFERNFVSTSIYYNTVTLATL